MNQIHSDITNMTLPSWLTSIPTNLGSPNHGKLKADQWRVLGSTFLPVSLVCLWSAVEVGNPQSKQCSKILQVTISVLSAVSIASLHVMSVAAADLYLQHMQSYISSLKALFSKYSFSPTITWHFICTSILFFMVLFIHGRPFLLRG